MSRYYRSISTLLGCSVVLNIINMTSLAIERALARALSKHISPIPRATHPHIRHLSSSSTARATALPITAAGPPPQPPQPSAHDYGQRIIDRRKKAELLRQGKEIRLAQHGGKSSPLRKRFWNHVNVITTENGDYQISLDTRPVRTPSKSILTVPGSKPHLAHAIAVEWDLLTSAQQALKTYNIPLTSILARAQDLQESEPEQAAKIRDDILRTMMRYLDTDTLLCWAPALSDDSAEAKLNLDRPDSSAPSLRDMQIAAAREIIGHLNTTVWPGVELKPVLEENTISPSKQSDVTRSIISGWISGLPPFELAALERAVLASKSLLIGTRLMTEWSENYRDVQKEGDEKRFGIEEAAMASTIEVRWQTGMWGEVEDTHDVDREDVRRQLGSAILLVAGTK